MSEGSHCRVFSSTLSVSHHAVKHARWRVSAVSRIPRGCNLRQLSLGAISHNTTLNSCISSTLLRRGALERAEERGPATFQAVRFSNGLPICAMQSADADGIVVAGGGVQRDTSIMRGCRPMHCAASVLMLAICPTSASLLPLTYRLGRLAQRQQQQPARVSRVAMSDGDELVPTIEALTEPTSELEIQQRHVV